jgi:glycosyltransferase involved in cell wall biosynthesis
MHIVFVHRGMFPERVGGTYTYLYDLGSRLAARGHEIDVIASTREPDAGPPYEVEGMTVHTYSFRKVNPLYSTMQHMDNTLRLFRTVAERRNVDVLSIHDSHLGLKLARSRDAASVCQIPTYHAPSFIEYRLETKWMLEEETSALKRAALRASSPPLEQMQRRFERGVLEKARGILVLSEFVKGNIEAHFPSVDASKVRIIPSGVDTERFSPPEDRGEVRRALGIGENEIHLVTTRKLVPRMGLENLLRALPVVRESGAPDAASVTLTICGRGRLQPRLESIIDELGLGAVVKLAGHVSDDDLVRYYQASDLFVLPTAYLEGFGISTIEALSTNTPVVGTPAGATPEILGLIDQRLLSEDTSAVAIADAIVGWLSWRVEDEGSTRYRDQVLELYAWDRVVDQVEGFYAELSGSSGGQQDVV